MHPLTHAHRHTHPTTASQTFVSSENIFLFPNLVFVWHTLPQTHIPFFFLLLFSVSKSMLMAQTKPNQCKQTHPPHHTLAHLHLNSADTFPFLALPSLPHHFLFLFFLSPLLATDDLSYHASLSSFTTTLFILI